MPPKASLLELLSDTQLREFIGDDDRLRDLEFVRILGMNAEHSRKVKRTHAQLAADISTSFLEAVAAKLDGQSAPPRSGGITEAETRRAYIDVYLEEAGWDVLETDAALRGSANARISFSTYQTMINKIDGVEKEFTAGRFDLIVVDEAHRSVFNKYGAIFKYFDALLVGLTATPRGEVNKNTYSIFQCESDVPDFDYSMEQGFKDGVLKPYRVVSRTSQVLSRGITYRECSDEERRQLDEAFDDEPPDRIESSRIFNTVYNQDTVDKVIDDVLERGLKVDGGETIGKTIIFAYNHRHADLIVQRIKERYPHDDDWCQLVDNYVNYADDLVEKFKHNPKFRIAVSVDMLDTGIDVPEVLNLVFFKPVRSRIKFIQMIGRGTRPCKNVFAPGKDKTEFRIFDYCDNFRFFGNHLSVGRSDEKILHARAPCHVALRVYIDASKRIAELAA